MSSKLTENSYDILTRLAECQMLTISQLSAFSQRSRQVVRRNIRTLGGKGFIACGEKGYGQGKGRREKIISLTGKGVKFLRSEGILLDKATFTTKDSTDSILANHHLVVNWFHIHLLHMESVIPWLSVNFLSSNSLAMKEKDKPSLRERVQMGSALEGFIEFIPDGTFSITRQDADTNKTLLFFIEVDMDTEALASRTRNPKDLRQKIVNYQALFRSKGYKRHERIFGNKLTGFRLLFLANDFARMTAICRLVQEIPPSDFIWVTDQERMFSHGLSAEIWARGGKIDTPPQSIIGSILACDSPVLETIR